jgi:hypothetical protein
MGLSYNTDNKSILGNEGLLIGPLKKNTNKP